MHQEIMDALVKGVSTWVTSFFQTAAKRGLTIFTLAGLCVGLGIAVVYLLKYADAQRREFKTEMKEELAAVRNDYRTELAACNEARKELADKVADLTVKVAVLTREHH